MSSNPADILIRFFLIPISFFCLGLSAAALKLQKLRAEVAVKKEGIEEIRMQFEDERNKQVLEWMNEKDAVGQTSLDEMQTLDKEREKYFHMSAVKTTQLNCCYFLGSEAKCCVILTGTWKR